MYLTRLALDPRGAQARRDLANAYELHRTLSRAFVSGPGESPSRFLWRLEASGSAWACPQVLVQAAMPGDWTPLERLSNYLLEDEGLQTKQVDLDRLVEDGIYYRFRLVANPTVTREGKRYGLASEDQQLAWMQRQGERHGFTVANALVMADDQIALRRAERQTITLRCVRFEGVLRIVDRNRLVKALTDGVGPAKAFGCGLLSIARLRAA